MRKVKHILLLVVAVLLVAGCSPAKKVKDIRLTSWEIREVKPQGFRGLNATIAVGIDNPAMSVTIDRLEGMIHSAEREFARFETTSGVQLAGKSEQVYEVPCTFSLCDGFNVLHVFALMETRNLDDLTVDVVARVRVKGISKTLRYSDISIKDWIK